MHGIPLPVLAYESPEWYEARRRTLGASEIAAALGLSPWQSAYSLWCEKTGRLEHREATPAMRFGQLVESTVLDMFEEETGLVARFRGDSWRHPDVPWATASPDALALESPVDPDVEASLGIVEAKTDFSLWDEDSVPDQYQLQVAWQMWVLGLDRAWIPLLATGSRKFRVYELQRDEHLISVVRNAAEDFWQYVRDDVEPPVDAHEATSRALAQVHSDPDGDAVAVLDDAAVAVLAELATAKRDEKAAKATRTRCENEIKQMLGDAPVGVTAGGEVAVTWKQQTARRIDTDRLRAELPDVADKYTTESTFRVLRPKEIKS